MTLRLYNTLTRTKEDFTPIDPNNVRMYVCGPTVYDFAHIGNARPVIVFDVLFRLLRHLYGESHVTYVRNITDVDDKINARALRDFPNLPLNEAIRLVTEKTANQFQSDAAALGCLAPTEEPRATDNIQGMIDIISTLINKGHAYTAAGEVLFSVSSMADYGKLSGRKLEDQQAGARVAVEAHKKNPADFVLWKLSSADEPGWDSPWGRGRPGWHIECSAMSERYLGKDYGHTFDIHGGGLDLIFPHHENEIAQSRCAHGTDVMAKVWMHNGFLQVEGQKMSKSLGNFVTIADVRKDWDDEVARLNMLSTHYRQPIDWTFRSLQDARRVIHKFKRWFEPSFLKPNAANFGGLEFPTEFVDAISDDLNISAALAVLHRDISLMEANDSNSAAIQIRFCRALALLGFEKLHLLGSGGIGKQVEFNREEIIRLIEDRLVARHTKNWKESDRIRDELDAMGIAIKDNKDGTTSWEVKR
jgi:cysteinyl-tRNA synthetase